jgi:hypothetical protein
MGRTDWLAGLVRSIGKARCLLMFLPPWRPPEVPRDLSVIVHTLPAGNVLAATGKPSEWCHS